MSPWRISANVFERAPAAAPVAAGPSPGPSHDAQRRGNYGVRRLELLPGNLGYLDLRGFAGFEFGLEDSAGVGVEFG